MNDRTFFILDVFAESPLAGNQLAVFPRAESYSTERMHALTREMNYSESTFITGEPDEAGRWPVRIFTPGRELPFAGHPTLGTADLIREVLAQDRPDEIVLDLAVGPIPVRYETDEAGVSRGFMTQNAPEFGAEVPHEEVAAAIGLEASEMVERHPCQSVSTGIPFLIAPVRSLAAVRRARLRAAAFDRLVDRHETEMVLFFAPEAYAADNQINARMFAPTIGVYEDPATGSANGCLAGYLSHHRFFGEDTVSVRVEQGTEIHRPSLLFLRAEPGADGIRVQVGGRTFRVARGELES